MSLQIGPTLREAAVRLVSRTGAILLVTYLVLLLGMQSLMNTVLAAFYRQIGLGEAVSALPLVLDVSLTVAGVGILVAMLLASYHSLVSVRTFVAGARDRFPADALTRNVPLALANLIVGGIVYSLLVFLGSLLLLVPGIFAYVAFLFMAPYVAVEDRNFVDALRSSYRLTAGNRLMLFALVVIVVAGSALLGGIVGFASAITLSTPFSSLVTAIIQVPVALYSLAVISVAFDQLRSEDAESPPSSVDSDTDWSPA